MGNFENDLRRVREDLQVAQHELLELLDQLEDEDLGRAKRGGWTVRRVLQHVLESDYATGVTSLRGQSESARHSPVAVDTPRDAICALEAYAEALLAALSDIDEESFYRMGEVWHQEYSILSLLENAANHQREHTDQIRDILDSSPGE